MKKPSLDNPQEIAHLAALLLIDGGADSFQAAKEKAARSAGLNPNKFLPSNKEVHIALAKNLTILEGKVWQERIQKMRKEALRAMKFFHAFDPHLVGGVLYGTATEYSVITLHLFSDEFEQVVWCVREANIDYQVAECRLSVVGKASREFPSLEISMDGFEFDIVVLPTVFRFNPPTSPLDGKPYLRADEKRVKQIIDDGVMFVGKHLQGLEIGSLV